jgi:pyruvyltransferase
MPMIHMKQIVKKLVGRPLCDKLAGRIDCSWGNIRRRMLGTMKGRRLATRAFWCAGTRNFGDLITPFLLERGGIIPICDESANAQLAATGSILEEIPDGFSGIIFGSGFLVGDAPRSLPDARVLAVRGALTRDLLQAPANCVLGDPGLLAPAYLERTVKRFALGIVPHYVDSGNPAVRALKSRYPSDISIIDVAAAGGVARAIRNIDECEHIISSSLHGLIIADALGIPCAWTILSERIAKTAFKFFDYCSAFGDRRDPMEIAGRESLSVLLSNTRLPASRIDEIKARLATAWDGLLQNLKRERV